MTPTEIKLRRKSRVLEVVFDDGTRYELPFEYLRVFSPSAEVRGHGAGERFERRQDLTATTPDRGTAVEKKRDIGTEHRRPAAEHPGFRGQPEEPAAPEKNGGGIAAAAAEPAPRRDPLLQIDPLNHCTTTPAPSLVPASRVYSTSTT